MTDSPPATAAPLSLRAANLPSMSDFHDITLTTDIPARATCPACGFSQKVRRDGTIGAHVTATSAEVQNAGQCPGAGQLWITASPV